MKSVYIMFVKNIKCFKQQWSDDEIILIYSKCQGMIKLTVIEIKYIYGFKILITFPDDLNQMNLKTIVNYFIVEY